MDLNFAVSRSEPQTFLIVVEMITLGTPVTRSCPDFVMYVRNDDCALDHPIRHVGKWQRSGCLPLPIATQHGS